MLSTIHSAKGGEWDVVHVIHAADGMIPSDMATGDAEEIEEERRLFYVALTRARDVLYRATSRCATIAVRAAGEDAHTYAQLTRFLPEEVRAHFEESAPTSVRLGTPTRWTGTADVDAFLAGLWAE